MRSFFFVCVQVLFFITLTSFREAGARQVRAVEEYTVRLEVRERNGKPLPATLTITSENTQKVQRGTSESGVYIVSLPAGQLYRVVAAHRGYQPVQKMLRLDRVTDMTQAQQTVVLEMVPEVTTLPPVTVTVVDYETNRRITPRLSVQVQDLNGQRPVMTGPPREGRITINAEANQRLRMVIWADGYIPYEYVVEDVRTQNDVTVRLRRKAVAVVPAPRTDLPAVTPVTVATAPPLPATVTEAPKPASTTEDLHTLTTGKAITLDNVYFDQSSYQLRPESYRQLDQLAALLKQQPALKIEISGHTDKVGDPRLNMALSVNRAKVITTYLVGKGIPESRLRYRGYGQTRPIAPSDTEENKRKNRRVEVRAID